MIFKNINSEDIPGLIICSEPPISSSAIRTKETTIDGRDGAIVEKLGYKTRIRNVEIGLKKDANVDKILSYFSGEGDLIFKNENDKVYKAAIYEQVDLERLLRLRKGSVAFYCQPFKYKRNDIFEIIKDNKVKEKKGEYLELLNCAEQNVVDLKLEGSTTQATRSGNNLLIDNFTMKAEGTTYPTITTLTEQNTPMGLGIIRKITIPANNDTGFAGCRAYSNIVSIKRASVTDNFHISGRIWIKTSLSNDQYKIYITGGIGTAMFGQNPNLTIGDWKCFELNNYEDKLGSRVQIGEYITIFMNSTITETADIKVAEAQINDGVLQDWEQYGASPSPDYPSEIENVEGKNKFNKNTVTDNYLINKNDGTLNANASYCVSDYIDVQGISKITLTNFNVYYSAFYDKDKKFLSSSESTSTINVPNNAKYFRSSLLKTNKDIAQLEEGTIATPYVPYNSLEIKDIGENLFDCANSKIIYNNSNTSYERLDNGLKLISSGGQYNMIYFLVDTVENLKGKTLTLSSDILFSKEKQYVSFGLYYTDFNSGNRESFGPIESIKTEGYYTIKGIVEEGENRDYVCIGLRPNMDSNFAKGDYTIYDNLQVEIGETATPYKPYQEQKVTFPLESQKLMKGSYLASDGIHHKRAQKTVTIQGIAVLPNGNIGGTFQPGRKKYSIDNGLCCDKAKHDPNRRFVTDTIYENEGNIVFVGDSTDTLETLKEKYDGAILEYLLAEEEIVPYTTEQQEAYNQLQKLKLYKGQNTMFSLEGSIINLKYLEDTDEKVENQGNIYSKPIIRLEKTVFKEVEIAINGIRFKYNFEEDDYVEIDCEEMTVQYEGLDRNRRLVIDFEFPKLKEGNNDIVMYSGDCIIKFKRKDRWL